ncbi:MAG: CHAP domain-containing protein [Alphaproteobacteria bacterium]|nr:CHAP domain-containing protein [Alphaproteobacteria bacterium]
MFAVNDARFLNLNFGADWCAAFVYYILTTAGYPLKIRPFKDKKGTFGLVGIWADWARAQGTLRHRSYEPVSGDLVIYNKLVSGQELNHIGIVLESTHDSLVTAEGNVENKTGIFKRRKNETIAWYINI